VKVESFHGWSRDECLKVSWFSSLASARKKIEGWQQEYNYERPHSSLGYLTPMEFRNREVAFAAATLKGLRAPSERCDERVSPKLDAPLTAVLATAEQAINRSYRSSESGSDSEFDGFERSISS